MTGSPEQQFHVIVDDRVAAKTASLEQALCKATDHRLTSAARKVEIMSLSGRHYSESDIEALAVEARL